MAQHFDVIVIGGQLAGRICAGLLARAGRRVLVVDQGEASPTYRDGPWVLPRHTLPAPNHEASAAIKNIHRSLNFSAPKSPVSAESRALQVILERKRFKLHVDGSARRRELTREIPQALTISDAFWQSLTDQDIETDTYLASCPNLTPWGWVQSWLLRRQWRIQEASVPENFSAERLGILEAVVEHPAEFFSFLRDTHGLGHARLQGLYLTQPPVSGRQDKSAQLALDEHLKNLGVEFRRAKKLESVEVKGRELIQLFLKGDKHRYAADYFLANSAMSLDDSLPEPHASKGYLRNPQVAELAGGIVTLNLVVRRESIPDGMQEQVLLADASPSIFITHAPIHKVDTAGNTRLDPTHSVLSLSRSVSNEEAHGLDNQAVLTAELEARAARLVPFLAEHIVAKSFSPAADHLGATPEHRSHLIQPAYETKKTAPLGVVGRNLRTRFKNLLHVGQDVLPGLGVEGEYLTGQAACNQLQKLAKRKWRPQLKA